MWPATPGYTTPGGPQAVGKSRRYAVVDHNVNTIHQHRGWMGELRTGHECGDRIWRCMNGCTLQSPAQWSSLARMRDAQLVVSDMTSP
jgi:hypothetical protein